MELLLCIMHYVNSKPLIVEVLFTFLKKDLCLSSCFLAFHTAYERDEVMQTAVGVC